MAVTQQRIVVAPDEGETVWLGGLGVIFKVAAEETGGAFAVVEHPIEAGRLVPPGGTQGAPAGSGRGPIETTIAVAGSPDDRWNLLFRREVECAMNVVLPLGDKQRRLFLFRDFAQRGQDGIFGRAGDAGSL